MVSYNVFPPCPGSHCSNTHGVSLEGWKNLPTDIVINIVEKVGYDQGFPTTGLKFTYQQGQIYLGKNWVAGVDYIGYEEELTF